ncbi:Piso0_003549 [Millerozyma farinosa CBS 7064]|uniref:Piso0_003549 protein n=1 Tax=Pichia sorbitophila (strain ATCC MYA-4447 / BCRC 22081 / CBS 7064 / NBRC 10061 / NRRL Y-12695) TaxID=559304 RepID=G8YJD8_PICSO|nr:Piso0_003549 [Millerozyma farinosa CBS 7064]CCE81198.1 Piso0_003549 [Millerozyma farinosa CBS 7064]
MSLISNRKRPRGFSEAFDTGSGTSVVTGSQSSTGAQEELASRQMYQDVTARSKLGIELGMGMEKSGAMNTLSDTSEKTNFGAVDENSETDGIVIQDTDSSDDDSDVIILDERRIDRPRTSRRNNSDSILTFHDAFAAYNLFNVNNDDSNTRPFVEDKYISNALKKQRKNSLPQLPQARCFYSKPANYVFQGPKLGNVKANIIPHSLNLPPCDDKDGHYIIKVNDIFANRFLILRLLGQGTFGKVVECYDKVNRETVAIKIIRNIPKYRDAAKIELRILSTLKKYDNKNENHCIHLRECFDYRGHICIVTDLLKISLYDFLEKNKYIPFPGSHIQAISKQLIRSVTFLHDLNLIHTDLKPENILLYDDSFKRKALKSKTIMTSYMYLTNMDANNKKLPKFSRVLRNPSIQIIDFGSAIFDDEYHSSIVSTRHYRAPEIVLGIGWSFPCDIWSIGCILLELMIGEPLFKTHDNLEHLAMIEKVCGKRIDKSMVRLSKEKENECGLDYFTDEYSRFSNSDNDVDILESDLGHTGEGDMEVVDSDFGETEFKPSGHSKDYNSSNLVSEFFGKSSNTSRAFNNDNSFHKYDRAGRENIVDDRMDDGHDMENTFYDDEEDNELRLIFPSDNTPAKFINSVDQLDRIDIFISKRIGLNINFDKSLSQNYAANQDVMDFGNFTFWWFFIDLLKNLLVINPEHRLTAAEALEHPWFNLGIEDEGTLD